MATAAWFVVAPVGESQGTALNPKVPSNAKIVEANVGSAAYNAWTANGSYGGYQVVMGPFATEAEAKQASPPSGLGYLTQAVQTIVSTIPGLAANEPASSAVTSGSAIVAATTGTAGGACLWNLSLPVVGSFCVLTKTEARAMIAGLILGMSGVVGIIGLGLIVVEGFASTGAGQAAGKTLERVGGGLALVPGAEAAGVLVAGAGSAARRGGPRAPQRRQQRAAADQGRAREIAREERQRAAKPPAKPATTPATSKPGQLTDAQRAELRARADQISTRQEPGR